MALKRSHSTFKNDEFEIANIQAILDCIPKVRIPTPPPRNLDATDGPQQHAPPSQTGPRACYQRTKVLPLGKENCLAGLSFVFTGLLETLSREKAQGLVNRYGGQVSQAPSSKTNFVVLGSDPGPSKLRKIKELNIKAVGEDGLFELIRLLPANGGKSAVPDTIPNLKRPNAFATMMSRSKQLGQNEYDSRIPSKGFDEYPKIFEEALTIKEMSYGEKKDWARIVCETVIESVTSVIMSEPYHHERSINSQTKINALHALIDIAAAIAYAPQSKISDAIRSGRVPGFLIDNIYRIQNSMTALEIRKTINEMGFISKVKALKRVPSVATDSGYWVGLDDILRLLKDPGPVDFRLCFKEISRRLDEVVNAPLHVDGKPYVRNEDSILDIVRDEIMAPVRKNPCYETKYNAMKVLLDIGIKLSSLNCDSRLVQGDALRDSLCQSMLKVVEMMTEEEIDRIMAEFRSKSSPSFYGDSPAIIGTPEFTRVLALLRRKLSERECNEQSLVMRITYLRWSKIKISGWEDTKWDELENVLDNFVDNSTPFTYENVKTMIYFTLDQVRYSPATSHKQYQEQIIRHISKLSKTVNKRSCFETKVNGFNILLQIAIKMYSVMPTAYHCRRLFVGHVVENALTEAIMAICCSLRPIDWVKLNWEDGFKGHVKDLEDQHTKVESRRASEEIPGLSDVLKVIRDPSHILPTPTVDLTDVPTSPPTIDLTDD